jgi:hypothetical protein
MTTVYNSVKRGEAYELADRRFQSFSHATTFSSVELEEERPDWPICHIYHFVLELRAFAVI